MSNRFHQKYHRYNHHSVKPGSSVDPKFPDAGYDPIASFDNPFQGEFFSNGNIITTESLSAKTDLTVDQNAVVGNNLLVGHNLTVNNDINILGDVNVQQNLSVYGDQTLLDTEVRILSSAFLRTDLYVGGNIYAHANFELSGSALINQDLTVGGSGFVENNLRVGGNLTVEGDSTILYTNAYVTSSVNVYNRGVDTALVVTQSGNQDIAHFIDEEGGEVIIGNRGIITAPAIILLSPHIHQINVTKKITLPVSAIDVELLTTENTMITGFEGGTAGLHYTLTNVGTHTVTISSTTANGVYIRNGTSWRSNTSSLSSAFLMLMTNHSCSLRKGNSNKISVW
jgi:hypothetical protein